MPFSNSGQWDGTHHPYMFGPVITNPWFYTFSHHYTFTQRGFIFNQIALCNLLKPTPCIHPSDWPTIHSWLFPSSHFKLLNSLRPRQNRRHFADDIFKCNFLNGNVWILIEISLKFVLKGPINNITALVQIMARRRAIIWTNDDPVQPRIYASLGLNELNEFSPTRVNSLRPSDAYIHR